MEDDIKNIQSMIDIVKGLEAKGIINSLDHFAKKESLKEDVNPSLETVAVNSIVDMVNSTDENDKDGINKALSHIISFCKDLASDYDVILEEAKEVHKGNKEEVVDNQSDSLLNELQEALKDKSDLEVSVADVQNKLAVSDAKVESLNEELSKYKELATKLSSKAKESKELSKKVSTLEESLKNSETTIKQLKQDRSKALTKTKSLNESVLNKNGEVKKLNKNLVELNDKVKNLTEELEEVKADSELTVKQSNEKINRLNKLVESYKNVANSTMKRYIESKATMYGLSFQDIRRRLPDSYTADDVDAICESLRSYNINLTKLPVGVKPRMKFTESKRDNLRIVNDADEINDELIELAKLK